MAFPVIAGINSGTNYTQTNSHTVNLPSSVAAGDLLLVFFYTDSSATIDTPAGWTAFGATADPGGRKGTCFRKIAAGGETSITVTTSANNRSAYRSMRITGHGGTAEAATATASGTTQDPANLTPSWGALDTKWIAVLMLRERTVSAYPTSYSNGALTGTGANMPEVATCDRNLNASSEDPAAFTISNSEQCITVTVGVKPVIAYSLVCAQGSYSINGQAANFTRTYKVAAAFGSYSINGQSAGLETGHNVFASFGSYAIAGQQAGLSVLGAFPADFGEYAISGQNAGLLKFKKISAVFGSYVMDGKDATFARSYRIEAVQGSYALTGKDVDLFASLGPRPNALLIGA